MDLKMYCTKTAYYHSRKSVSVLENCENKTCELSHPSLIVGRMVSIKISLDDLQCVWMTFCVIGNYKQK